MADKESRELGGKLDKVTLYRDGEKVTDVQPIEMSIDKSKGAGALTVKLDIDASDVITGLKSIQREAKKATQALKEFEVTVANSDGELIASITQDDAIIKDGYTVDVIPCKDALTAVNELRDIQGLDGNWDHDTYMCGLFNGLELASATLEGRTPDYREIEDGRIKADLSQELANREGVMEYVVPAHGSYAKLTLDDVDSGVTEFIAGPAIIIVNKD